VTGEEAAWFLPQTTQHHAELSPDRTILEWWDLELQALIDGLCARDGDLNPCTDHVWWSATKDIERVLASQGCTS